LRIRFSFFEGEVWRVSGYEYDTYMIKIFFAIDVMTTDTANKFIYWQFRVNEDDILLKFVRIGQKLKKVNGGSKFTLTGINGIKQEFNIPYCN
jgi:hypothetical protein